MLLQVENKKDATNPSEKVLLRALRGLKTYGPSSIAILAKDDGSFVQVGGGRVTCVLERRDANTGKIFRAHKTEKSKVFKDGDILSFSDNKINLAADEWLMMRDAEQVFVSFLGGLELPRSIHWRELPGVGQGT